MKLFSTPGRSGRIVASARTFREMRLKRERNRLSGNGSRTNPSIRIDARRRRVVDRDEIAARVRQFEKSPLCISAVGMVATDGSVLLR